MAGANGKVVPADFPPPVNPTEEFVKRSLDAEDERIEIGVAIVGGGTAGLACANRLLQLLGEDPEIEKLGEVPVAVIEKAKTCGGHNLSGAVMRPGPLQELSPTSAASSGASRGFPGGRWKLHRNDAKPMFIGDSKDSYPQPDGELTFDKPSSVFISGNATRDDAPSHIRVQKRVPREVAETWRWMCPAGVYEIPDDAPESGDVDVIVNYTNCVQCGAITAKGGRLITPEGGDGPLYQNT